jgi:hypothetical protein
VGEGRVLQHYERKKQTRRKTTTGDKIFKQTTHFKKADRATKMKAMSVKHPSQLFFL